MVITHAEKVLFPDDGITKGELADYYKMIAPLMLPHIIRRPVTMERFPAGIGKKGFIQKDVSSGFPDWLQRVEVPKKDGVVHHPIVTDSESLLWLVNQNCITPHVWTSRTPEVYYPDICVCGRCGPVCSCRRRTPCAAGSKHLHAGISQGRPRDEDSH